LRRAVQENKTSLRAVIWNSGIACRDRRQNQNRNGIDASAQNVIVLNGGMQGLFAAFQSTVDPGDEVLSFSPYWTPIKDLVAHCSGRFVVVPTEQARAEGISETLAKYVSARTRVIYFNTPTNPSGAVFTRQETEAVARFAINHDLVVIADEAYEDLVYDGEHISIASLPGMFERTITTFTLSKSYAMTGWRIGYAVAGEPWMTGLAKATLYSSNGVSTPTQWAALAAFTTESDFLETSRAAYRERRDLLVGGLNELGLNCAPPPAPSTLFLSHLDQPGQPRGLRVSTGQSAGRNRAGCSLWTTR
jgi:aspartate aminotransferase